MKCHKITKRTAATGETVVEFRNNAGFLMGVTYTSDSKLVISGVSISGMTAALVLTPKMTRRYAGWLLEMADEMEKKNE